MCIGKITCRPLNLPVTRRHKSLVLISVGPLDIRALLRKMLPDCRSRRLT